MLKNRTEAEEAAQDSFVKLYYHLKDFDLSRSFAAWAASIAMNECRDRLRKRARASRAFRDITEADGMCDPANTAEIDEAKIKLEDVEKALDQLPKKLKEVIVLKAYAEYSYDDIARILKVRIGTVMSRLFRARQKLTEILDRSASIE
jgi:RNA polymerase sigma-70 factor (ECF subfamily)